MASVELNGHDGPVYSVAFSPDGRRVATAADDRTARIWDVETGRELHRLIGHTCNVQVRGLQSRRPPAADLGKRGCVHVHRHAVRTRKWPKLSRLADVGAGRR